MEAASTSETLVNFYQTTRRNVPEDSHLHIRRHENLKSHLRLLFETFFAPINSLRVACAQVAL
jgi:hypothetical protein